MSSIFALQKIFRENVRNSFFLCFQRFLPKISFCVKKICKMALLRGGIFFSSNRYREFYADFQMRQNVPKKVIIKFYFMRFNFVSLTIKFLKCKQFRWNLILTKINSFTKQVALVKGTVSPD